MKKPIHPILVHFPIALVLTSFAADLIYFFSSLETLRHAGWWMLAAAAAAGSLTVAAGVFDMRRAELQESVHARVHQHMWVGMAFFAVICGLAAWRWTFFDDPAKPLTALYLDFAFLAVALAAFQGWLGGELVYTHGVFVARESQGSASHAAPAGKPAAGHDHKH